MPFASRITAGIGRTLAPQTQHFPNYDSLFRRGQFKQAQAPFHVTSLRDLAERQTPLDGRPFAGTFGAADEQPTTARPPRVDVPIPPCDVPRSAFITA